jgi:hypothetical protein
MMGACVITVAAHARAGQGRASHHRDVPGHCALAHYLYPASLRDQWPNYHLHCCSAGQGHAITVRKQPRPPPRPVAWAKVGRLRVPIVPVPCRVISECDPSIADTYSLGWTLRRCLQRCIDRQPPKSWSRCVLSEPYVSPLTIMQKAKRICRLPTSTACL